MAFACMSLVSRPRYAPQPHSSSSVPIPASALGAHTSIGASVKPSASMSLASPSHFSHQFVSLPSIASPGALRPGGTFLASAKVSTTRRIVSGSFLFLFKGAIIPYISAGDPDLSATAQALKVLDTSGSETIEMGIPHFDPLADGPVIQAAATQSLARGSNFDGITTMLKVVLLLSSPVALFSNFDRILKLGVEKLMSILNDAGVQGQRPSRVYDVFISYKQDDMRDPVSHLKNALERREIKTFVDFTLDGGVEFPLAIDEAIKRSEIAVVIVSPNFHSSPWCLNELVKILECREKWGCIVLPIFWGMDAKELQEQPTHFVDKIGRAAKGIKQEKPPPVQRWRGALLALGLINGWSVSRCSDKTEADVIEDLADRIAAKLSRSV